MNPGGDWDVRDLANVEVDKERCQAKENVAVDKDKVSEDSTRLSAGAGAGNSSLLIGAKWKNRAKVKFTNSNDNVMKKTINGRSHH
jgi:hypothetical protein